MENPKYGDCFIVNGEVRVVTTITDGKVIDSDELSDFVTKRRVILIGDEYVNLKEYVDTLKNTYLHTHEIISEVK